MASLPRNNPDKFYDLMVQIAIISPGPIVDKMIPYMERWQGRHEIAYPHSLLDPVLRRTLGIPLFQKQLLRIATTIVDFIGGEAEELRRALGSRRSADKMRTLEIKLREGMNKNQVGITMACPVFCTGGIISVAQRSLGSDRCRIGPGELSGA